MSERGDLRVALVAGSLTRGGAEKQLVYLARTLSRAGVHVRVFALARGEHHEPELRDAGVELEWVAAADMPPARAVHLCRLVRRFRPHVVQATHFFVNLYVVAAARLGGATEIGCVRNDLHFDMSECGVWGGSLLRTPRTVLVNSRAAAQAAAALGVDPSRVRLLPNVIDLAAFDAERRGLPARRRGGEVVAAAVARLVPAKRLDRFLRALHRARAQGAALRGLIVGDGPERPRLQALASELGLSQATDFTGGRSDVPRVLGHADLLVLTSDHEGFPNVILEGMAACLPVVATPAGDAASLVTEGQTGYVVPFDDEHRLAERLGMLAGSPTLRRILGERARAEVEREYGVGTLLPRALHLYRSAAAGQANRPALRALDAVAG
jgi:glycosyltransferase involved in cell wall biosynthesis